MARDHRKLHVFAIADELIVPIYRLTADFPSEERYGLRSQLRRGALSIACNIVEGSARRTTGEYLHFLNVASASANETRYLLDLAHRLELLPKPDQQLTVRLTELIARLQALIRSLDGHP